MVSLNQLQQTQAMKHTERMTVLGAGVLESLLCLGVFPVCPAEETVRVGKCRYVVSIALSCDARVVVEVSMGDDKGDTGAWMCRRNGLSEYYFDSIVFRQGGIHVNLVHTSARLDSYCSRGRCCW